VTDDDAICTTVRELLSAHRDGATGLDEAACAHMEQCLKCIAWIKTFDQVTRHVRLRAPMAPASVTAAVARIASHSPPRSHAMVGQALLIAAAVGGMVVLALGAAGIFGHSHLESTDGRLAEALLVSLFGGFGLAAWRPARLAPGLLPVAVLAASITLALSVIEVVSGAVPLLDELAHLPLLVGAAGAIVATRATVSPPAPAPTRPLRHLPVARSA
jgi:peptidoglycan/LPS O-acetylase OafA/YrhL